MVFTSFVYSVTRPLHNTTTAVIPRVVPKTPSLRLLVFGACFYDTFYRPEFRLHGYVFFSPGARCRDFTWACVPPQHIRPRAVVHMSPVTFACGYSPRAHSSCPPGAPPPTTIPDRVCRGADVHPDADVGVATCARGTSSNHGR